MVASEKTSFYKDPEYAWQAVLDQLQMDMAKATYDTWVRDATFVDFSDGVYTIGVPNANARDWLESRLTSTVKRLLTGMFNQKVAIAFVVLSEGYRENINFDEIDQEDIDHIQANISQGLYRTFTRPDRAHWFDAYLFRWIPFIGPNAFWTLISARQEFFARKRCLPENGHQVNIAFQDIANLTGRDEDTIRDHFYSGKLNCFLRFEKTNRYYWVNGGVHRYPYPHTFISINPPTPEDRTQLIQWFTDNKIQRDPIAALESVLELDQPHKEILSAIPSPTAEHLESIGSLDTVTFQSVILKLCGLKKRKPEEAARIIDLVDLVSQRIIDGFGKANVSLYFLKHRVRDLGAINASLVTLMRRRCYVSEGEIRDSFYIPNTKIFAKKLGVSTKSISRAIPGKGKRERSKDEKLSQKRSLMSEFVLNMETASSGDGVEIKMNMQEPLIDEHRDEYKFVTLLIAYFLTVFEETFTKADVNLFIETLEEEGAFSSDSKGQNQEISKRHFSDNGKGQNQEISKRHFSDNRKGQIRDIIKQSKGHFSDNGKGQNQEMDKKTKSGDNQSLFKYLKPYDLKDYLNTLLTTIINTDLTTTTTNGSSEFDNDLTWTILDNKNGVGSRKNNWNLNKIISQSNLTNQEKIEIKQMNVKPAILLSHLMYTFSSKGQSLTSPWRYIMSKLKEDKENPDSTTYYFARKTPADITSLIRATTFGNNERPIVIDQGLKEGSSWAKNMVVDKLTLMNFAVAAGLAEWK